MSNLNWVDNTILFLFLVSVLAGLMRGFIKEVISLLTWVVAFFVAAVFSTKVAGAFTSSSSVQSAVSSASDTIGMDTSHSVSLLSVGVSFVLLFVVTLIIGSIINSVISRAAEGGGISFINRILGACFGLARGFIMVLVAIFIVELTPLSQQPWWLQSQFVTSFDPSVEWLSGIVSPSLENLKTKVSNTLQNVNPQEFLQRVGQ